MRFWINVVLCAAALRAGPVEFGTAELDAAIEARNFKYKPKVMAELNIEAPETYRIEPYAAGGGHVTGGDLRGLMYGLLEAAEQIRTTGHLKITHGIPALALRGVRMEAQPDAAWFISTSFWEQYFAGMARSRFNRLEIDFDPAPASAAMDPLRIITQIAQQYAVDVAIGFGGPTTRNIAELLRNCPAVRTVVLHGSNMPDAPALLQTLHDSGRRVVLELPDDEGTAGLIEATGESGAPLRLFADYTGTALNPQPRDAYWDMDASLGVDAVDAISGAGFEVHPASDTSPETTPSVDAIAEWGRMGYARPVPKP